MGTVIALIAFVMGWAIGSIGRKRAIKEAKLHAERAIDEHQKKVDQEFVPLLREAQAKADRYFVKINDACAERDFISDRYHKQSLAAGNAQSMMMVTIEKLARDLQSKGGKPQIPNAIKTVMDEFIEEHVQPAKEAMAEKALAEKGAIA